MILGMAVAMFFSMTSMREVFAAPLPQNDAAPAPVLGPPITGSAVPCVNGKAKGYDCLRTELLAYLPPTAIGGGAMAPYPGMHVYVNDMWGWTDTASEREFALICLVDGVAFVEVTDPVHPRYLGKLPLHAGATRSVWRDVKVYADHAFVVADIGGAHGMQVFDLRQLLAVTDAPVTFAETAHYPGIASVHNIVIDTVSGFAYTVGGGIGDMFAGIKNVESCGGGLHMIDIRHPAAPAFAGCYSGGSIHDAQCVVYHGPDKTYQGRQICLNAGGLRPLTIVDVTDKAQPKVVSTASYPSANTPHQGWLTDDHRYFLYNDEGDEEATGGMTRTIVFDLNDLDDPIVAKEYSGTTHAIDHNLYVRGRYVYEANYKAGLRILDIADPADPKEVGYFDTTPGGDNDAHYGGAWSDYPFFKNGVVGISSIEEGFFLVRFTPPPPAP